MKFLLRPPKKKKRQESDLETLFSMLFGAQRREEWKLSHSLKSGGAIVSKILQRRKRGEYFYLAATLAM